jgi:FkbH-like protein
MGWAIRLKDRFADHGIISVVIIDKAVDVWTIDSWIMSCRVLERRVEQAILNALAADARAAGAGTITGVYRPTERNGLVKDFFDRMGFAPARERAAEAPRHLRLDAFEPPLVPIRVTRS